MKKKGNYKIYNRQIWGILYRDTFRKMSYMYREWLSGNMKKMLQDAMDKLNN